MTDALARRERSREKRAWYDMRARVTNPHKAGSYTHVAVCTEWDSFARFLFDVGFAPSEAYTLERIDNDLGYAPGNVRWATKQEQARNRRTNRVLTLGSRSQSVAAWADELGVDARALYSRLAIGWDAARTLTTPVRRIARHV